jgi:radical SAM enzyme (TIGR01210 family)
MEKVEQQILKGSQAGGKKYHFDNGHNPELPAQYWFQNSHEGLILFIVFYTQACKWSRCIGCNLPSLSAQHHINYKYIIAQIDHIFNEQEIIDQCLKIGKVIISNNGSILDQDTFSSTALMYLMAKLNLHLPNLSILSIETRPEFVEIEELEFLSRSLMEGDSPTQLELAIGFEAFDEKIRNDRFKKGLKLEVFEKLVRDLVPYNFMLKLYFMLKPVADLSDVESIRDIHMAIDYLSCLGEKYNVRMNMHLNPTFVARGTILEDYFHQGKYTPPTLLDTAKAAAYADGKNISIYIGLYDEDLAVEGGSFIREGEEIILSTLEEFNRTQDFTLLHKISNS